MEIALILTMLALSLLTIYVFNFGAKNEQCPYDYQRSGD